MTISKLVAGGLAGSSAAFLAISAHAGSGGYFVPANYHPLDNLWKIALTIAVVWLIIRQLRSSG